MNEHYEAWQDVLTPPDSFAGSSSASYIENIKKGKLYLGSSYSAR